MSAASVSKESQFCQITEAMKPKTREDGSYRLAFLTAHLSMVSSDYISDALMQCRNGSLGEAIRARAIEPIAYDVYSDAIKHLTCILLYLISFEQGETCPDWLADFLASSVRSMDQVVQDGPSVKAIMERYVQSTGEDIYNVCPRNIFYDFGYGPAAEEASHALAERLQNSIIERSHTLLMALTKDRDYIEKAWRDMIAQNTLALE
jgi:hypothetical protein